MPSKRTAPVDPELERQLAAAGDDAAVEAVFTLRPPSGRTLFDESQVRGTVDRIVKSAQTVAGQEARDLHVLPSAQSFVLAAPPKLMRAVLSCGEIASALANAQSEDLAIDADSHPPTKTPPRTGGKPRRR